jgi:ParB family chromosome partitioning protein
MDTYKLTQEEVSQKVSKSRSAVANALRLLALPEQVLDFVRTGELSAGHARTLLGLTDADTVIAAANKVISEELSVRKTEELVKKLKSEPVIKKELDSEVLLAINELESRARQGTGNKVKIRHSAKNNGKIEIFYGSTAELEKLIDMLSGR